MMNPNPAAPAGSAVYSLWQEEPGQTLGAIVHYLWLRC
jgi:hypothetical protein